MNGFRKNFRNADGFNDSTEAFNNASGLNTQQITARIAELAKEARELQRQMSVHQKSGDTDDYNIVQGQLAPVQSELDDLQEELDGRLSDLSDAEKRTYIDQLSAAGVKTSGGGGIGMWGWIGISAGGLILIGGIVLMVMRKPAAPTA